MIRAVEISDGWGVALARCNTTIERCRRGELEATVPEIAWAVAPSVATPLHVLCWRARYLPLIGRDADKHALLDWVRSGTGVKARILVGDAGSGKTRLAAEVAAYPAARGLVSRFRRWGRRTRLAHGRERRATDRR